MTATPGSPPPDAPPADVLAWLEETYHLEGVAIWLACWRQASPEQRERMERHARTDPMGT